MYPWLAVTLWGHKNRNSSIREGFFVSDECARDSWHFQKHGQCLKMNWFDHVYVWFEKRLVFKRAERERVNLESTSDARQMVILYFPRWNVEVEKSKFNITISKCLGLSTELLKNRIIYSHLNAMFMLKSKYGDKHLNFGHFACCLCLSPTRRWFNYYKM